MRQGIELVKLKELRSASNQPVRSRTALAAFAALASVAAGIVGLGNRPLPDATNVRGRSNTVWLSGEAKGRIVLASAGAQRSSVGVSLSRAENPAAYDVVDLQQRVFVHDRATGIVSVLDGRDGRKIGQVQGPVPADSRSVIVAAGDVVFVIDVAKMVAHRIDGDAVLGDDIQFKDPLTDWVGTSDGRLWVIDEVSGAVASFSGQTVDTVRLTSRNSDLSLSAIGSEPVVLDRTVSRLRWLRRSDAVELPPDANSVLQEPDLAPTEECMHVISAGILHCVSPDGIERSMPMAVPVGDNPMLFASSRNAVTLADNSATLIAASWEAKQTVAIQRPTPTGRVPVGRVSVGALVIDDPGSPLALTIDRGKAIELDKLSRHTIVIGTDGTVNGLGLGSVDANAQLQVALPGEASNSPTVDTNDRNDPPVAIGDLVRTRTSRPAVIDVLANDRDPDGDLMVITEVTLPRPAEAEVEIIEGSRIAFVASPGFVGTIGFEYKVEDPQGAFDTAPVSVEVISDTENTPPELVDDEFEVQQGSSIDLQVLDNDSDAEGDTINIIRVSEPSFGSASPTANTVHYEPRPGAEGVDEFTYTAIDSLGAESTATVTITLVSTEVENLAPIAVDDRVTTAAGRSIRVDALVNDSDPEGGQLVVASVAQVDGVVASVGADQGISLRPDASLSGTIFIPYTIVDDKGLEASASIALQVNRPTTNRPPRALDDSVVAPSTGINISPLSNDIDPDGDSLVVASFDQPTSGGTVSRVSATVLRFEPSANTGRQLVKFNYRAMDPSGKESAATVNVQVIPATGAGPIANPDSATIVLGDVATISVLSNDSHPDGLAFNLAGTPTVRDSAARATVNSDGSISYSPPPGQLGTFSFSYTIQDSELQTSSADVVVTVENAAVQNRPPFATDDTANATAGVSTLIDVVGNDSDPDGDPLMITSVSDPYPTGSATIESGKLRFLSPLAYSGLVTLKYTVSDGKLPSQGQVTVLVAEPAKLPPVARPDLLSIGLPSGPRDFEPMTNDFDPEGQALTLKSVSPPPGVTATISSNRTALRISVPQNLTVTTNYAITYFIEDGQGLSASSQISIVVEPPANRPPNAVDDSVTIASTGLAQPVATLIDVLSNDSDPDGGQISLRSVGSVGPPSAGTAARSGNKVSFTPSSGFQGDASFSYVVADANGNTGTASVNVKVDPCQAAAFVLRPDSVTSLVAIDIPVADNDISAGGTLVLPTQATPGYSISIVGSKVRFIPEATPFSGSVTFEYRFVNSCGDQSASSVQVTGNRSPIAVSDTAQTVRGRSVTIAVLSNDTDADAGDSLSIRGVGAASDGQTQVTNGEIEYTPDAGFNGTDSFTYTIVDTAGATATATVTVEVANPSNAAPVAVDDDSASARGEVTTKTVLINDTDAENDPLQIGLPAPTVSPVTAGTVVIRPGERVRFTPDIDFVGRATVTYAVTDGTSTTTGGVWTIDVINSAPVAGDDRYDVIAGEPAIVVDPLINDSDPDPLDTAALQLVSAAGVPADLDVSVAGRSLSIRSSATSSRTETFTYTVSDGLTSATATVTVNISVPPPPNNAPECPVFTAEIAAGESGTFTVSQLCSDLDGDPLTITAATNATFEPGRLTVTVAADVVPGTEIIVLYDVTDGIAVTSGRLTVTVTAGATPP